MPNFSYLLECPGGQEISLSSDILFERMNLIVMFRVCCNLSPTLFNLFINDLPDIFNTQSCDPVLLGDTRLSCLLYADDLVILSESECGLQSCLTKLHSYTKRWKLKINLKKSKILIFGTQSQRRLHSLSKWYVGQDQLGWVDEYNYLGITFHFSGGFKLAQKLLYNKALRAYHSIFKSFSNIDNVPVKVLLKLFPSLVVPVLLYGCEVWGVYLLGKTANIDNFKRKLFKTASNIEKLHLKFCKRILGVHSKSTNSAVHAELGRVPMIVQISSLIVKYWLRITNPEYKDTIVGTAACSCVKANFQGVIFTNHILEISDAKSLTEIHIPLEQIAVVSKHVKTKLNNHFSKICMSNIQQSDESGNGGKSRTYRKVKFLACFENYLSTISILKHRQAVTRLRLSAHKLPVESGRYKNIPYDSRLCIFCNLKEIGDEFHYLSICTNQLFVKVRSVFLNDLFNLNSAFRSFSRQDIFMYTLSMKDSSTVNLMAKYCHSILTLFDNLCTD